MVITKLKKLRAVLLALSLTVTGCDKKPVSRIEAIKIAENYINETAQRSDLYPHKEFRRVVYERNETWLVKYIGNGGTGVPPTVEIDKKSGRVLLIMGAQ